MASPTLSRSNNEDMSPAKQQPKAANETSNRRALGEVSPNVRAARGSMPSVFAKKPSTGSPLKRSFTAAMEGGQGFTYLKKRRLSVEMPLSQIDGVSGYRDERFTEGMQLGAVSLSPKHQDFVREQPDIPTIEQCSPTEPNTPSTRSSSGEDSSADRKSFSSLINYDPASQQSTAGTSLVFKTSHAEMLKLRLRVAMYKVRTNQTDVPFTELRVEGGEQRNPKPNNDAVEEAIALLRKEAQERMPKPKERSFPRLQPAPVLRPTAYSSRMIYDRHLPSSPPIARSPIPLPASIATPTRTTQLSSPPDSAQRISRLDKRELTSSVVKGRVAEGLLGLRNAA